MRPILPALLVARLLSVSLILAAGCGPRGPVYGTVSGKVTVGAKPVTGGSIVFENAAEGVARPAALGADGSYEVRSYKAAGLPVGTYKVAVYPGRVLQPGEDVPLAGKKLAAPVKITTEIPERFHKVATSKLSVTVKPGTNPPFDFDLSK